jgi:hypothetical protein
MNSLDMNKTNADRLKLLVGFLRTDDAKDMGNMEKAAAEFLELNASIVEGMADAMDEKGKP